MKISIYTDGRKPDKQGLKSVYIRCTHPQRTFMLNTGIKCTYEPDGCMFPKQEQNARAKSARITDIFTKCEQYALMNNEATLNEASRELTAIVKGEKVEATTLAHLLYEFAETKNEHTRGIYELTARKVEEYDSRATLTLDERWLAGFKKHFMDKGMSVNGISIHLRNIRSVFNYARRKRMTDNYPFLWFKIEEEETLPNNLTAEQIRQLRDYPVEPWQELYRDIFMLSFYLAGINMGDLLLCPGLKNGRLVYKRRKTGKLINIAVCPEAKEIIKKYKGKDYLLNVMDNITDYRYTIKRMNQQLKKIGMKYVNGIGWSGEALFPDITTYTARYSFASIAANDLGISENLIGRCLGHSWSRTVTQRYIAEDQKKVDEVVMKVAAYITE